MVQRPQQSDLRLAGLPLLSVKQDSSREEPGRVRICSQVENEEDLATDYVTGKMQMWNCFAQDSCKPMQHQQQPMHPTPCKVAAQKYVYTPLCQLQEGTVVNVYGVVAFFKLPYRSKGTDFCSVVTIVDQSHEKLRCTFFSGSQDSLPKIYKVGDVVRFHRIKIKKFNSELYGVSSSGFSALAFDGTPGSPLLPRTSSKNYSFTKEDQTSVESLRNWQMGEGTFSRSRLKLSDIQPGQYFDLICQLIGKAELDKASYLLKVWDGTRCVLPTWKVFTEDNALVGDRDVISRLQYLSIDVLVYDNHVEAAKSLEVGSCIVIQNIHVKLHNSPNETEEQSSHLEFQLHGGTMYGRGITVLPENHGDVKELQQNLHTADLNDNSPLDAMSPLDLSTSENQLGQKSLPFDALERCQKLSVTVLPTHQQWPTTPLATIIESKAPQKCRIKAQLRGFQPRNLYQSIKLHCNKCCLLQNIKDEDVLNSIFLGNHTNCLTTSAHNKFWYQSVMWRRQPEDKSVTIHFVKKYDLLQNPEDSLILVEGGTYNELCKLSRYFNSIIPVKSKQEDLGIDLSAPFLIQGNRWHYGNRPIQLVTTHTSLCHSQETDYGSQQNYSLFIGQTSSQMAELVGIKEAHDLMVISHDDVVIPDLMPKLDRLKLRSKYFPPPPTNRYISLFLQAVKRDLHKVPQGLLPSDTWHSHGGRLRPIVRLPPPGEVGEPRGVRADFGVRVALWLHYIDDLLMVWRGPVGEQFVDQLNHNTRNIRLTCNIGPCQLEFLDLLIRREGDRLVTTTYRKPTAGNTLLHFSSHHPWPLQRGIPLGQFLRIRRNCGSERDFVHEVRELTMRVQERGYHHRLLRTCFKKALDCSREDLLKGIFWEKYLIFWKFRRGPNTCSNDCMPVGCIKCSSLKPIDVLNSLPHDTPWNAAEIAKALGIEPLIQLFVMQLTLEDETGSLDAYLWRHSEQFFQISASEIFMDNQLQERLYSILTILCPPAKPKGEYPWMDCCIKSYNSTNRGKERVSYEIFDTQIFFSPE
ncbi:protection of telomeres protein 1 [Gastrophryne carolinensis]